MKAENALYYGDNLDILRRYVGEESVDLVYLDPPFKSDQNYNVLFADRHGSQSAAQIKAFEDTWHWDLTAEHAYLEAVETGGRAADVMRAFRTFLGENDMMAYLAMIAPRLVELRRVLKPTGSIYLHCDPTASHYLKMLMDAIFSPRSFRNEIVWQRTTSRKAGNQFGRVHDIILFYTKTPGTGDWTWNPRFVEQTEENVQGHDLMRDENGELYRVSDLSGMGQGPPRMFNGKEISPPHGRHWAYDQEGIDQLMAAGRIVFSNRGMPRLKTFLKDLRGVSVHDVWTDIEPINAAAGERLGYPTQKPEALLERIIASSSNEGDVVLDPFCGCGTTIAVAQRLGRRWIGIDITHLAITLMKHRLQSAFGSRVKYTVIGEPVDLDGADALAKEDPYQFQWWALGLLSARPVEQKKGADRGIDGRLYFHDEGPGGKTKQIIFSVKAGRVTVSQVRDLVGVLDREKAEIGVFISLEAPTREMRREAATAGQYKWAFNQQAFPRLQLLTIEDILDGKRVNFLGNQGNVTFKGAPKAKEEAENMTLTLTDRRSGKRSKKTR